MSKYEEDTKIMHSLTRNTVKCKCGHSVTMANAERTICSWCGKWVYKNSKVEFKYRLKEKLREVKDDRKRFV